MRQKKNWIKKQEIDKKEMKKKKERKKEKRKEKGGEAQFKNSKKHFRKSKVLIP